MVGWFEPPGIIIYDVLGQNYLNILQIVHIGMQSYPTVKAISEGVQKVMLVA